MLPGTITDSPGHRWGLGNGSASCSQSDRIQFVTGNARGQRCQWRGWNTPQNNSIESKKQKQCHWNGIENILRAYVSGLHWWRDIYKKKKSAKFWISDYLLVEIFFHRWNSEPKARKCKSWMKNFASIAGNIGLAWTVYRSFACFFLPPERSDSILRNLPYSWIMQRSRATRGVRVLFAMIWRQFRL